MTEETCINKTVGKPCSGEELSEKQDANRTIKTSGVFENKTCPSV